MTEEPLPALRDEIKRLDAAILDAARRRIELARRVGDVKLEQGLPLRNYRVEAEVIDDARRVAAELGVSERLAEEIMKLLIAEAVRAQEVDRRATARRAEGTGQRALVIGGRGQMGAWFAEYLDSKGMSVAVADLSGPLEGYAFVDDWEDHLDNFDVVCVATPPSTVGAVLSKLAGRTDGLVIEIASLKSPFLKEIEDLVAQGTMVASLHPMWGPKTDLLASKNLVVCDCGDAAAARAGRALFEDTAARIVEVPLRQHDSLMAFTLGLPHAMNLAFSSVLREVAPPFGELAHLGGPTFTKQVGVAREVARENKDLYFEIQKLNVHTPEVFSGIRRALDELEASIGSRDAFLAFMRECEAYWGEA